MFHLQTSEDDRKPTAAARYSTPSSTFSRAAVLGGFCPATCHLGTVRQLRLLKPKTRFCSELVSYRVRLCSIPTAAICLLGEYLLSLLSPPSDRAIPAPLQPAIVACTPTTPRFPPTSCWWFAVVPRTHQFVCRHNASSQSRDQAAYAKC